MYHIIHMVFATEKQAVILCVLSLSNSNFLLTYIADNSSVPKIEPDIHVAKFLRITTDPPIDVDKWYKKIRKCTMSERSM